MNCRKCGCEILEENERCPVCDAKRHNGDNQSKANHSDNQRSGLVVAQF